MSFAFWSFSLKRIFSSIGDVVKECYLFFQKEMFLAFHERESDWPEVLVQEKLIK